MEAYFMEENINFEMTDEEREEYGDFIFMCPNCGEKFPMHYDLCPKCEITETEFYKGDLELWKSLCEQIRGVEELRVQEAIEDYEKEKRHREFESEWDDDDLFFDEDYFNLT